MSQPLFTVITTCLDRGVFIERTICSVLDQAHESMEYIVIDRGSTDDTRRQIARYQDELTFHRMPDATRAEALSAAVGMARGEYLVFVDDLLLPCALHEAASMLAAKKRPAWVVACGQRINESDFVMGTITPEAPGSLAAFLMHDAPLLPLHATILRRSVFDAAGLFDASLPLAFEYEFCCRLLVSGLAPTLSSLSFTATREPAEAADGWLTLQQGVEHIEAARRFMRHLPRDQQHALWINCDQRQRIYALAEAELRPAAAPRQLWRQLEQHPWWIRDESFRRTLVHGVAHPAA